MPDAPPPDRWADALAAAALLAVDPAGLGGALLRARHGAQRSHWLAQLRLLLPAGVPMRRAPLGISDERLLGGLDLTATLQTGRPVAQRGLLADSDGGLVLLAMAERLSPGTAARLCAVLDQGEVQVQRDGISLRLPARIALVALDEGADDDEQAPAALADRLAFQLPLDELPAAQADDAPFSPADIHQARDRLAQVGTGDDTIDALCQTAQALGVASLRAPWLALRAARAAAALQGHAVVQPDDAALAARLVLAPRATRWPAPPEQADQAGDPPPEAEAPPEPPDSPADEAPPPPPPPPPPQPPRPDASASPPPEPPADDPEPPATPDQRLDELVLEAARSALPAGLLARLKAGLAPRSAAASSGRAGAAQSSGLRGRPTGARRGELRRGTRLDLIATLRAAAPWQRLRQQQAEAAAARQTAGSGGSAGSAGLARSATRAEGPASAAPTGAAQAPARRLRVLPDDIHVSRHVQRRETTTVFVVDASGSSALHRLAEAKGAVEQLLADCYVRRDRVALVVFRGQTAELVLPPTRSLVRAKRALAGQPGGGGTPLASALDMAAELTGAVSRRGGTPVLVVLTDGRANIGRQGQPGRTAALADALDSARRLRASGIASLVVDTSPRPASDGPAAALADALAGVHLPLPQVDAAKVSKAVQAMARV